MNSDNEAYLPGEDQHCPGAGGADHLVQQPEEEGAEEQVRDQVLRVRVQGPNWAIPDRVDIVVNGSVRRTLAVPSAPVALKLDTEIELSGGNGLIKVNVTKQKDGEELGPWNFGLESVGESAVLLVTQIFHGQSPLFHFSHHILAGDDDFVGVCR